jgi:hypothetical protein
MSEIVIPAFVIEELEKAKRKIKEERPQLPIPEPLPPIPEKESLS